MARAINAFCAFMALAILPGCTLKPQTIEVQGPNHQTLVLPIKDTLRINLTTEPPTLDFNKSSDSISSMILQNIMDGLVSYDLKSPTFELKPALASKWTATDHARKWTFDLRGDVKWTDGVPFTAQQMIDSWQRLMLPETASEYASYTYGIKNAKLFNQGKLKDFSQVGVKAVSPTRIEVELERPMSYFPYLLTNPVMFPIRLDLIKKFGNAWTAPENIQTLGAYKLVAWQHDRDLVLERNESYFDAKPLASSLANSLANSLADHPAKYVMAYMIVEQATALNLFEADRLDVVWHLASAELRALRLKPEYTETGILQTYFYGINTRVAPMNDKRVRRALGMAIDRATICKILAGGEKPLTGWIPPGVPSYDDNVGLKFDPKRARELLKEAGYSETHPLPKIILSFNTNEDHQRVAEAVQAQLKENLGIRVELKNEEWKSYLSHLQTGPSPLYRFGWLADYPDPDNFMSLMVTGSENNSTGWASKDYDALIEQGASEVDLEKRKQIYTKAQKFLLEDEAPVLPIFVSMDRYLINKRVQNFPVTASDLYYFKLVSLKQ